MSAMPKAGDAYRELVGAVMAALDPGSAVKTEQWIEGPDGERDMDVEVRGTMGNISHFVLVECKDHAKPIGIGFVDAFESKIRDLRPDRAVMFSNSGFTCGALKKAKRVGIEMASAIKARDRRIRVQLHCDIIARRLSLAFGTAFLYPFEGHSHEIEEKWKVQDLLFDGVPVIYWINKKMKAVALECETASKVVFICTFRAEQRWSYRGRSLPVGGLRFDFIIKKDWVAQTVTSDISLGYYDHLKRRVVIPNDQQYVLGLIDWEGWEETDRQWSNGNLEPGGFRLKLTLVRSDIPNSPAPPPKVDNLIVEHRIDVE